MKRATRKKDLVMTESSKLKVVKKMPPAEEATPATEQEEFNPQPGDIVAPDPFNVASLRLPPSFEKTAGIRKVLTTVPVRKPNPQEWVRVHPGESYRGNFATILLKEEREFYLVAPAVAEQLRDELTPVTIYTAITKTGTPFLWPARLVGSGNRRTDLWYSSAHEAAEAAMKRSVRVTANMELGAYEHAFSDSPTPENDPAWPDLSLTELLRIGFQKTGRFVTNFEHPVIKMLRGMQ
jgi:hypothetical protein